MFTFHQQRVMTLIPDDNLQALVSNLTIVSESLRIIEHLTSLFDQQVHTSTLTLPVTTLTIIEQWAWRVLSDSSQRWHQNESFIKFLQSLHGLNTALIIRHETISAEEKQSLLIPSDVSWIDRILDGMQSKDDQAVHWLSAWIDTLSSLSHEHPEFVYLPVLIHLNNRLSRDFLMTGQYKAYVKELQHEQPPLSIFTAKQQFYVKTCSYSLHVYLWSKSQNFPFKGDDIIQFLRDDFTRILRLHSKTIHSWSEPLLTSLAHFIGLICAVCWWGGHQPERIPMIVTSQESAYEHIYALIDLISYRPFYQKLTMGLYNAETVLIDTSLIFLYGVIERQELSCWVSSNTKLVDTLLILVQMPCYDRIRVCVFGLIAEILSDEQIKHLQIAENISESFFRIIEHAWKQPTRKWKKIPMGYLLKGRRESIALFFITFIDHTRRSTQSLIERFHPGDNCKNQSAGTSD